MIKEKTNPYQNLIQGTLKVPWITMGLTSFMIVLYLGSKYVFDLLLFNKEAISSGEIWRFFTGHFIHCSFEHLFWDALAFIILGAVIELNNRRELIPSLIVSCLVVSSWLYWGEPQGMAYCGLSGALNGMLVVAAMILWQETKNGIYLFVILATVGKILFEGVTHQTIFTSLSSQAIPSAHAAGIFGGICYILLGKIKDTFVDSVLIHVNSYATNIREIDYDKEY